MVIYSDDAPMLVAETLTISDSLLEVTFDDSFSPLLGQIIPLAGYDALTGMFFGLDQDDTFMIGDTLVSIDYGSGTTDAISLQVIPEPRIYAAMAGLLCLAVCFLRKKR